jgi:excinuclease ABC subunit A
MGLGAHAVEEEGRPLQVVVRERRARRQSAIQIVNAKEHNLKSLSVNIPRGKFSVVTGRVGLGQVHAGVRHPVQRRPAPLPGKPERLRPQHRAAGRPARGGRGLRHSAHGGHRAAPVARRAQEHGGHHHRGLALPAPAVREAGHPALRARRRRGAPQTPDSIAAQLLKRYRGQHIGLLAPLVVNRKGVYTELADWARPRGYTHLRVDGELCAHHRLPAHRPLQGTHHRAAGGRPGGHPANEACCASKLATALEHGKGVVHVLAPLDGLRAAMAGRQTRRPGHWQGGGVLHQARLPGVQHQLPRAGPAPVLVQQQARLVPRLRGHGREADREQRKAFDDTVRDDDNKGREQTFAEPEVEDVADEACPTCQGTRLNPGRPARCVCGRGHHRHCALSVHDVRRWVEGLQLEGAMSGREAGIARDLVPEIKSRLSSWKRWAWAT